MDNISNTYEGYTIYVWNGTNWINKDDPSDIHSGNIEIHGNSASSTIRQAYIGGTISAEGARAVVVNTELDGKPKAESVDLIIDGVSIINNWVDADCGCALRTQNAYNNANRPSITAVNCVIANNINHQTGGVIDNVGGTINLISSDIIGNTNTGSEQVGAAISNRHADDRVTIDSCIFYKNKSSQGGGALYNVQIENCIATIEVSNSKFLTGGDNIFCDSGTITFQNTNHLAGSMTKNPMGNNIVEPNASLVFINEGEPIDISCTFRGNNTLVFNNKDVVRLNLSYATLQNISTIVINPNGNAGEEKAIAYGTNWNNSTPVIYSGSTGTIGDFDQLRFDSGTLSAVVTAKGLIMNDTVGKDNVYFIGKNVEFVDNYSEDIGTCYAGGDKNISGNGVNNTSLTGRLFNNTHALTLSNLTYSGEIISDSSLTLSGYSDFKNCNITCNDLVLQEDAVLRFNKWTLSYKSVRVVTNEGEPSSVPHRRILGIKRTADLFSWHR